MKISKIWHVGKSNVVTIDVKTLREANLARGDIVRIEVKANGVVEISKVNFNGIKTS